MFKYNNYVFWLTSLILFSCSILQYSKLSLLHHIIPDEQLYPWQIVKTSDSGASSLDYENGQTLKVQMRLSPSATNLYPFANLNFLVGDSAKGHFVDWSKYSNILLNIRCKPQNVLIFSLGSVDSKATSYEDSGSFRPSNYSFSCGEDWTNVSIDLHRLNTPDWWLDRYNLDVSEQSYSLENTNSFSIMHSSQTPFETAIKYEIASAVLQGRNEFFLYGTWITGSMTLALFLFGLVQVRLGKFVQKKLELAKQELPSIFYEPLTVEANKDRNATTVLQHMAKEYSNPDLTLDLTVSNLGLSRSKINEILREQHKLTFSSYLTRLRMTEAARLLTEQDISVAEIGYLVGYKSPSYFNRAFKKEYACTPKAFRRYLPREQK